MTNEEVVVRSATFERNCIKPNGKAPDFERKRGCLSWTFRTVGCFFPPLHYSHRDTQPLLVKMLHTNRSSITEKMNVRLSRLISPRKTPADWVWMGLKKTDCSQNDWTRVFGRLLSAASMLLDTDSLKSLLRGRLSICGVSDNKPHDVLTRPRRLLHISGGLKYSGNLEKKYFCFCFFLHKVCPYFLISSTLYTS